MKDKEPKATSEKIKSIGNIPVGSRLCLLAAIFFIMLIATSVLLQFTSHIPLSTRTSMLLMSAMQGVLIFIVPAFVYARVCSKRPLELLSLTIPPSLKALLGILIIYIIGMPLLNQTIYWNEQLSLPASMKGIEDIFKQMENEAAKTTEIILATKSIGGMLGGIAIIGILTGLAEEMFFRGAFQQTLVKGGVKGLLAILIVAFVFSAMHFQFYGFVPRFLLGALFGYLLFSTGTLWTSVTAHALNNSIVVVSAWLMQLNIISSDVERFGVAESGFPWMALLSLLALIAFFIFFRSYFFKKKEV